MKKGEQGEMSFLQHLEELRWHIIRSVLAIVFFAILAFIYDKIIFDNILIAPRNPSFFTNRMFAHLAELLHSPSIRINDKPFQLINTDMSGQFSADMWISLIAGVILAFPFVIWEFWRFVAPALHTKERQNARGAVLAISGLFFTGVLFGYYLIAPLSIHFLGTYSVSSQITNMINLNSYFSTIASVSLASGLIFELPAVAYFLAKIDVISTSFLKKYRKHSIIVILIVAAIITPPDVFSQTLVAIPLYMLFEVSILIVAVVQRNKKKAAEAPEEESQD
jgi:sec-independent protein translocase protein TatC